MQVQLQADELATHAHGCADVWVRNLQDSNWSIANRTFGIKIRSLDLVHVGDVGIVVASSLRRFNDVLVKSTWNIIAFS